LWCLLGTNNTSFKLSSTSFARQLQLARKLTLLSAVMAEPEIAAAARARPDEDDRFQTLDLLACLGDQAPTTSAIAVQACSLAPTLKERLLASAEAHERATFDSVGNALLLCGIELPYKSSVYAAVAGLICSPSPVATNSAAPTDAEDVSDAADAVETVKPAELVDDGTAKYGPELAHRLGTAVVQDLQSALRIGSSARASRALRYLAELTNSRVVSAESFVAVLETILCAADDELSRPSRGANNVHARGEFLASIAMSCLPWAGAALRDLVPEHLDSLVAHVHSIRDFWVPNRWRAIAVGNDALASENFAEMLSAVLDMIKTDWATSPHVLPAYHALFPGQLALSSSPSTAPPAVELEPFTLPAHSKLTRYTPPSFRLCLLSSPEKSYADVDADGAMQEAEDDNRADGKGKSPASDQSAKQTAVDRFLLRQYVVDVLDNFVADHVRCAERLLNVPMLRDANDVIVEVVFSEMCATPMPANPAVYYGTVFVDLCKVKDSRLPVKLLTAVERMFQDSDALDPEVFDRLTEWFSFHLSNFHYKWNWADWAVYADADMVDKFPFRALFCRDVLDRSIRLSYYDRIRKLVPDDMAMFLPNPIGAGNSVRFSKEINDQLLRIVAGSGKQPPPVVKERLAALLPASAFGDDEVEANLAQLVALVRAILQGSARTLSHFDTLAERYMPLLASMASAGGVPAKKAITLEACSFWSASHLRTLYVLDKLSTYRIIDGLAILDYLLSMVRIDQEGNAITLSAMEICGRLEESPVWELARLVFSRSRSRLAGARQEVTAASGAAARATEGDAEEVEARIAHAKSSAQNAKTEVRQLVLLGLRRLFMLCDVIFSAQELGAKDQTADDSADGAASNGRVFGWRALGMMREMGRKHPEQMETLLDEIRVETSDCRERHARLKEVFEELEEVAGCDIQVL
jgi:nuclear cap-binding protein subunit 1